MNVNKTACFFGHRNIRRTNELEIALRNEIEKLITANGIEYFLFGSRSRFNDLCNDIVTELKIKYPYIQRIYVRAEFPQINESYRSYLLKMYDDTYFPEEIIGAGRASYVERNYKMIESSSVCVTYYDENYLPINKRGQNFVSPKLQTASGTRIAYKYAGRKKRRIINLASINV